MSVACDAIQAWTLCAFGLSAQPIEFLERHSKLSKNLEEQRRADFPSTMQWDSNGPSIAVRPAFVAASLSAPHETERQRHALKLARVALGMHDFGRVLWKSLPAVLMFLGD